jgi:hypothetical protein
MSNEMITLRYRKGYKGQVVEVTPKILTPIRPKANIVTEFIQLTVDGLLTIESAYAYDFASGPTIDYPEFIRAAALLHDALCQLHAEGYLDDSQRKQADEWFKDILMTNSKWLWLRWKYWYRGVRIGSKDGSSIRPTHTVTLKLPRVDK